MERDLQKLLVSLRPTSGGDWAFCVVDEQTVASHSKALMVFREPDAVTLVVPADEATGLDVRFVGTRIDLNVESSLEAVGLTAALSAALAKEGIAANVVAAALRDYVFVPTDRAEDAIRALVTLSHSAD
jgi:hypothetical protein